MEIKTFSMQILKELRGHKLRPKQVLLGAICTPNLM